MMFAGVASATTVKMDFEGLTNARGEYVDNFYNGGCSTLAVVGRQDT